MQEFVKLIKNTDDLNIYKYSNNLLELLKEINEKDAYINNINKKKNKLMLINKNILLDTYIRPIIYEKFEKW
jgi:hypothetical protein